MAAPRKKKESRQKPSKKSDSKSEKDTQSGASDGVKYALIALVALVIISVGTVGALAVSNGGDSDEPPEGYYKGPGTAGDDGILSGAEKQKAVVNELAAQGLSKKDYSFVDRVCCGPVETGAGRFGDPMKTVAQLTDALHQNTPGSRAILAEIEREEGKEGVERALNGKAWELVEYHSAGYFEGIGLLTSDGQAVFSSGNRAVGPGDAVFYYVTKEGKVRLDLSIRADCFNLGVGKFVPGKPGKPGQPPKPPQPPEKCPPGSNKPECNPPPPPPNPECPYAPGCKGDTPDNTPGPTGNGKPQPVEDTEPAGGSGPDNAPPSPGQSKPHNPPPVSQPPGETSPPAGNGGTTPGPTDNW